jgi:hypothetical protein
MWFILLILGTRQRKSFIDTPGKERWGGVQTPLTKGNTLRHHLALASVSLITIERLFYQMYL